MVNSTGYDTVGLWRVDRFELIFYNPRYRRWQYFAEPPDALPNPDNLRRQSKESLHRREIGHFLHTMRELFTSLVQKAPSFTLNDYKHDGTIEVVAPAPTRVPDDKWVSYLRYLRQIAGDEGIPANLISLLDNWIAEPGYQSLSTVEALTVLSLLPIMEDWDTWGCILRRQADGVSSRPDSFPPPPAAQWSEPFSIVELRYSMHDSGSCSSPCTQKDFLKDHVQIEGICVDLADPSGVPHHVEQADFFDQRYCKQPDKDERSLYQCYAHVIDPIFAASADEDRRQFVIAYPIPLGGRLHFLQVIVSSQQDFDTSISALWNDWQPIQQAFWTSEVRTFLQDELLRILTSAFQNEAYHALSQNMEQSLSTCLLRHIYHLLPVEAGALEEGEGYSYRRCPWIDKSNPTMEWPYVGFEWARDGNLSILDGERCEIDLPGEKLALLLQRRPVDQTVSRITGNHRAIAIVEQQMQYLENLKQALHDETVRKERDRQKSAMVVCGFLREQCSQTMVEAIHSSVFQVPEFILKTVISCPIVEVGEEFMPPHLYGGKNTLGRYVNQAFPDKTSEQLLLDVQQLTEPSLTLRLSEYFETGLVKLKTHSHPESRIIACTLGEAQRCTQKLKDEISTCLARLENQLQASSNLTARLRMPNHSSNDFKEEFDKFHQILMEKSSLSTYDTGLSERRAAFRIREFSFGNQHINFNISDKKDEPFKKHGRLFGFCPCCLLSDFTDRYEADPYGRASVGTFKHMRRLKEDYLYGSAYHNGDQYPTRLVEQLFFLPYVFQDETEWVNSSELVNVWEATGAWVASLYTYSFDQNTPKAQRLLVDHLGRFNRTLIASPSKAHEFQELLNEPSSASYLVIQFQHLWMNDNQSPVGDGRRTL
jgi:hypothetical protein